MSRAATLAAITAALLLAACAAPAPTLYPHGRADVLLSTQRGMRSLAIDAAHTYLSLANSAENSSAVLRSGTIINTASAWEPLQLGPCALGPAGVGEAARAPGLARVAGAIYLFQPTRQGTHEHSLCKLERHRARFQPRDDALRACVNMACERLWMTDLQMHDGLLLSNAGGGANVLAARGEWQNWDALVGDAGRHGCGHAAFQVTGQRLLAGDCAPGLRAYRLSGAGTPLAPLPIVQPAHDQRRVHVIGQAGGAVFAGVQGGLLKSADGGRSFRYVIVHAAGARHHPAISSLLALRARPRVLLAAGADAGTGSAYLAVSGAGGERGTDLTSILPGHGGASPGAAAAVTALAQDQAGRVLLTLNLQPQAQGRLLLLTLGGLD